VRFIARQLKRRFVDIYWIFQGPRIHVPAIPTNPRSMLFVCKGNICRSPFAEHFATKLARKGPLAGMKFGSAGLHVLKPIPPPDNAVIAAKQFALDLESHRSQLITLTLVESYDMIIAMEVWQYEHLQSLFPRYHEKLFLLPLLDRTGSGKEQGYEAFNIPDPYGGPASAFDKCFKRISQSIERVCRTISSRTVSA